MTELRFSHLFSGLPYPILMDSTRLSNTYNPPVCLIVSKQLVAAADILGGIVGTVRCAATIERIRMSGLISKIVFFLLRSYSYFTSGVLSWPDVILTSLLVRARWSSRARARAGSNSRVSARHRCNRRWPCVRIYCIILWKNTFV